MLTIIIIIIEAVLTTKDDIFKGNLKAVYVYGRHEAAPQRPTTHSNRITANIHFQPIHLFIVYPNVHPESKREYTALYFSTHSNQLVKHFIFPEPELHQKIKTILHIYD